MYDTMKYQITYSKGIVQVKNLIDQKLYDDFMKSVTPTKEFVVSEKEIQKISKAFKKEHGDEFFTTESPLCKAIESGLLVLPLSQGGITKCIVKKL